MTLCPSSTCIHPSAYPLLALPFDFVSLACIVQTSLLASSRRSNDVFVAILFFCNDNRCMGLAGYFFDFALRFSRLQQQQ